VNENNELMAQIELSLRKLEEVAQTLDNNSPEYMAIRMAATALLFIHTTGLGDRFGEYCSGLNAPLTEEQKSFLREHDMNE
jgi:hypothetical protein